MTNETEHQEASGEISKNAQLIDAAESFLANPLADTLILEDGSTERTLSTVKATQSHLDPIELKSITHNESTAYTLTEWRDLSQTRYYWSSDPTGDVTVSTTDQTGLLSEPTPAKNNPQIALGIVKQGLDLLQAVNIPQSNLKNRVGSALGNLIGRKVG